VEPIIPIGILKMAAQFFLLRLTSIATLLVGLYHHFLNIITELRQKLSELPELWSDNEAMVEFIRGEGVAKGVRHMELKMWYVRERNKDGSVNIGWTTGETIPSDKLTKLGTRDEHEAFTYDIMGHALL